MLQFIQRLQKEPEPIRKRFALVGALVITIVILILWLLTVGFRLGKPEEIAPPKDSMFTTVELSPLELLQKQLTSLWSDFKEKTRF